MIGTTKNDFAFKKHLINDLLNVVVPPEFGTEKTLNVASSCKETLVGEFELIYHESKDQLISKMVRPKTSIK